MSILSELGKERKSLSDVPIHLTGFQRLIHAYKYAYTNMFIMSGLHWWT
jgi:hypothetical protein